MRISGEQKLRTKSGYGDALLEKVASLRNDAVVERLRNRWDRELSESELIPLCFEVSKPIALSPKDSVAVKVRNETPLSFDMTGGEKLEIARYLSNGIVPSYGLAFRITEFQVKGSDPNDQGSLVEHPWVMIGQGLHDTEVTSLEKKNLKYGEEEQIVRWLALFNPQDIDVSNIHFSAKNNSKLSVLAHFGRTIMENTLDEEANVSGLQTTLTELRTLELKSRTDESVKSQYETKLEETNSMRDAVTQNHITDGSDVSVLFNQDYLEELFGENYPKWVDDIYSFLISNYPFGWRLTEFQSMIESPDTHDVLNDQEMEKVVNFLVTNNLVVPVSPQKLATNPYIFYKFNSPELTEGL